MEKLNMIGFKLVFTTDLSQEEVEECIEQFLREVDAKKAIAHVEEMTDNEINEVLSKF